MYQVTVHWGDEEKRLSAPEGKNLLQLLTEAEIILSAPCRGNGKCGKCRVQVDGTSVLACAVAVDQDLEVTVPRSDGGGLTGFHTAHWEQGFEGFGIALDIGTTTLAAALVDCATGKVVKTVSMLNPQRVCGADVISRIAACAEGKLPLQTKLIRDAAAALLEQLKTACVGQAVKEMTVCGNTTMLHLFCGVDPSPIGVAPYTPVFTELRRYQGSELGLSVDNIYVLPSASGYIGSDVVCGILALKDVPRPALLADLGTNGELTLLLEDRIVCASTAAGPALEGANIECGIGGVDGAICSVAREMDALTIRTISDGEPTGICGSGLADLMAQLLRCGIIDETGAFDEDCGDPLAERLDDQQFWITDTLWLSQKDVRQFQLAKAAIHAGIETLCESAEISGEVVQQLYIAGGLGYYLRQESILETGLIPRCFAGKIQGPGNTALGGAVLCLLPQGRDKAESIARQVQICELSCRADFSERFIEAMCFE